MKLILNFYCDCVCLNVLVGSKDNVCEIYDVVEGYVLVGVFFKNYLDVVSVVVDMCDYVKLIDNVFFVGLGVGDLNQLVMVSEIFCQVQLQYVNQVFIGVVISCVLFGQNEMVVNGLVFFIGMLGMVKIFIGLLSSGVVDGIVLLEIVIVLLKDMGGSFIKYFLMGGLKYCVEFEVVVKVCVVYDFWFELIGGIDLENYSEILKIVFDVGVSKIILYIYSLIIDKVSGNICLVDVCQLLEMIKQLVKQCFCFLFLKGEEQFIY